MQNQNHIVIHDPSGKFWGGAIVENRQAHQLKQEGVSLLPVNVNLFRINGVAGFVKREWGSGWTLENTIPAALCPLVLYVVPDHPVINFAVRLVPTREALDLMDAEKWSPSGRLRLVTDTSQHGVMTGGMASLPETTLDMASLTYDQDTQGWTMYGKASLNALGEGYYGFALYGYVPGMKVAWFALSQTSALASQTGLTKEHHTMRFPHVFKRYLGTIPAGGKTLGLDTVPTTGTLPNTDNLFSSRFNSVSGWPGHRLAIGYKGPGGATNLNVSIYLLDENSGVWLKVPQVATQLIPDQVTFFDMVCPMEGAQKKNDYNGSANPGSMEALIIVAANGPPPNGEYIFPVCFDITLF